MILALERVQWSFKHDLIVPCFIVVGLWVVGAIYYTQHTFAGGAISTPQQAIAAARRAPCIAQSAEMADADGWRAELRGERWIAHKEFYRVPILRLRVESLASAVFDARTGHMIECRFGVAD